MFLQSKNKLNSIREKTTDEWQKICSRSLLLRLIDIMLRSYGQVLFADNIVTGLFLLLALMMISGSTVLFSLVGIAVTSFAAYFRREERIYIRHGIFGFNGALFGFFWSWYFSPSPVSLILFVFTGIIVYLTHSALMKKLSLGQFNLPVMSIPAAIVLPVSLIMVYWLVYSAGLFPDSAVYIINGYSAEPLIKMAQAGNSYLLHINFSQQLIAWLLIFLGILINSRINAFAAGLGALTGYLIVKIIPAAAGANYAADIFIGFNAIPVAIGLFGVFIVAGLRTFFFTFAGIAFCTACWLLLVNVFGIINFPFLTLPFNITILTALIILRKTDSRTTGLYPVPLSIITTPENIITWHRENILPLAFRSSKENIFRLLRHPSRLLKPDRKEIAKFRDIVFSAGRIAILSGAGTSTESGIPDFRGNYDFWRKFGAEDFTYQNFLRREDVRARYWAMERQFYNIILRAKINPTHEAAKWLADQNRLSCIVTQNVDGLFQKAGVDPAKVIEIHGTEHKVKCLKCGEFSIRHDIEAIFNAVNYNPYCYKCYGILKPATVLMGEELDKALFERALSDILASDLLIVMGTSLQVEPVASIPDIAWRKGIPIVIINTTPTSRNHLARMFINYPTGVFFKKFLQHIKTI
ncbi:MAG TPA: urea transporter [Smithellaceae bacterium]|nr:urea transporter [Smithellaceae bacterium]